MTRVLAVLMSALILGASLAVPRGPVLAADIASEPVRGKRNIVGKCSYFNNVFIYGDPTDCPGDETVPLCTQKNVIAAARRFLARAHPHYRAVNVTRFEHVREVPDRRRNPSPLVRRYCAANVTLSNGRHSTAHFFVEEDAGFVGLSWSVSVCIEGYDRWRVYDGNCRVARPVARY